MKLMLALFIIYHSALFSAETKPICAPEVTDVLNSHTRTLAKNILKSIPEKNSREIGRGLVDKLVERNKTSKPTTNAYDFYRDTDIQMAFSDKHFDSIRRGCFKNQFQTNSSNGFASKSKRQKAEEVLIGETINNDPKALVNPKDKSHLIRPKYAYLVPTKPMQDVSPLSYSESYGNIYAVMKSEVKDRSTFTAQDSLKVIEAANPLNTKADYKELRKGKKDYWEAQIWGEVCFNDVAYFIINCPEKIDYSADTTKIKNYNRIADETFNKMKETGIPVYQCKKEMKGVNTIFTKGEILSKESLPKRQQDEAKIDK